MHNKLFVGNIFTSPCRRLDPKWPYAGKSYSLACRRYNIFGMPSEGNWGMSRTRNPMGLGCLLNYTALWFDIFAYLVLGLCIY